MARDGKDCASLQLTWQRLDVGMVAGYLESPLWVQCGRTMYTPPAGVATCVSHRRCACQSELAMTTRMGHDSDVSRVEYALLQRGVASVDPACARRPSAPYKVLP